MSFLDESVINCIRIKLFGEEDYLVSILKKFLDNRFNLVIISSTHKINKYFKDYIGIFLINNTDYRDYATKVKGIIKTQ